eukprot:ANDGO_08597.mRNA.1 hypothetical protein
MFIRNAAGEYEGICTWAELETLFQAVGLAPLIPHHVLALLCAALRPTSPSGASHKHPGRRIASSAGLRSPASGDQPHSQFQPGTDTNTPTLSPTQLPSVDSSSVAMAATTAGILAAGDESKQQQISGASNHQAAMASNVGSNSRGLTFPELCKVLENREFRNQHNLTYNARSASENLSALLSALSLVVDKRITLDEIRAVRRAFDYIAVSQHSAERDRREKAKSQDAAKALSGSSVENGLSKNSNNNSSSDGGGGVEQNSGDAGIAAAGGASPSSEFMKEIQASRRADFEIEGHASLRIARTAASVAAMLDRCGKLLSPSEAGHILLNVEPPVGSLAIKKGEQMNVASGNANAAKSHSQRVLRVGLDIRSDMYVHPDSLSLDEVFIIYLSAPKKSEARSISPLILRKEASVVGMPAPTKSGVPAGNPSSVRGSVVPGLQLGQRSSESGNPVIGSRNAKKELLSPRNGRPEQKLYALFDETVFRTDRDLVIEDRENAFRAEAMAAELEKQARRNDRRGRRFSASATSRSTTALSIASPTLTSAPSSARGSARRKMSATKRSKPADDSDRDEHVVAETTSNSGSDGESSEEEFLVFEDPEEAMKRRKLRRKTLSSESDRQLHAQVVSLIASSSQQVLRVRASRPSSSGPTGIPKTTPRFHPKESPSGDADVNPWASARKLMSDVDQKAETARGNLSFRPSSVPSSARRPVDSEAGSRLSTVTPRSGTSRLSSARGKLRSASDFERAVQEYGNLFSVRESSLAQSARGGGSSGRLAASDFAISSTTFPNASSVKNADSKAKQKSVFRIDSYRGSERSEDATTTSPSAILEDRTHDSCDLDYVPNELPAPVRRIPKPLEITGMSAIQRSVPPINPELWKRATTLFDSLALQPLSSPQHAPLNAAPAALHGAAQAKTRTASESNVAKRSIHGNHIEDVRERGLVHGEEDPHRRLNLLRAQPIPPTHKCITRSMKQTISPPSAPSSYRRFSHDAAKSDGKSSAPQSSGSYSFRPAPPPASSLDASAHRRISHARSGH